MDNGSPAASVALISCVAHDNSSNAGGVLDNFGGIASLTNCTFTRNQSVFSGSVVYNENSGGLQVTHCTLVENFGLPGESIVAPYAHSGSITVSNSIVAGNGGGDVGAHTGTIVSVGNNLIGNIDSSRFSWPSGDLTGTTAAPLNPLLAPLDYYGGPTQTMPPLPGSPAREPASGATSALGLADQRGPLRLVGTKVDIGAVEADAPDAPGFHRRVNGRIVGKTQVITEPEQGRGGHEVSRSCCEVT